ncbi:hypothetical protein H0H92_014990 [Tricholoma furcatifolium]|nr:hypothetical protein H0H92_014990 [Tricholoma furcatifolium]
MDSHLNRPGHVHASSYPSSFWNATKFPPPKPERSAQSDSASRPASLHSSPHLSPKSSPGHPSSPWRSSPNSRSASLERISGPPLNSKYSTPKSEPSRFEKFKVHHPRPWENSPRKRNVVPEEQTESYNRTLKVCSSNYFFTKGAHNSKRIARALNPVIDLSSEITHEVLERAAELLKLSPIPGLEGAARVLLGIWDAIQQIETNRLACLRLAERCADILIAIREEVSRLDGRVAQVLREPMENLERAFHEIQDMMIKQINQGFLRRYLKRDEVLSEIAECNTMLQDCLGHFDRSIQLRMLEFVVGTKESPSGKSNDLSHHTKEEIHESIRKIQERQNQLDRSRDLADEQNYTKARSQKEVTDVLEIEKVDIPDAIKTFLRLLESFRSHHVFNKVSTSMFSPRRSSTWPVSQSDAETSLRLRDREAIEKDIRALKAAYGRSVPSLPNWTITKFEIEMGDIIGRGFFSTVYKGKWGTRVVAIKVLEIHALKETFVAEVDLWRKLKHPNVLELYGASSAEGSLPWFLVSPLMLRGSVPDYLKRLYWEFQSQKESGDGISLPSPKVDFLGMMFDIAEGMRYLHEQGVNHGDLKAANVLVADDLHCIVSDFGQSEWLTQAQERNITQPNHALRWQSPERMRGESSLTKKVDVYAFSMTCVEILSMGSIPWPTLTDDDVRQVVLDENGRPPYPENLAHTLKVEHLLRAAWHQSPSERPSFKHLVQSLRELRAEITTPINFLTSPRIIVSRPKSLQNFNDASPQFEFMSPVSETAGDLMPMSPRAEFSTPFVTTLPLGLGDSYDDTDDEELPPTGALGLIIESASDKPPSTIKDDVTVKERYEDQFEYTYRMCLSHGFPRQLNFPLWTPSEVALGDVGYLTSSGQFIRLFSSFNPFHSSGGRMKVPSLGQFGKLSIADRKQKDKNLVWKSIAAISKLVSPSGNSVKTRHTFSLAGERTAFLCAEKTQHQYIEDDRGCKRWFRAHWDSIIREYGEDHILQKEDLMLIVETLSAEHYALFANHGNIDHDAHFDVFASPASREPWGAFSLPSVTPNAPPRLYHSNVSLFGSPSKTILVARLRFQTDAEEPTMRNW